MSKQILVIGGTGKTGRKVVQKLKQQNQDVRVGSRSNQPSFDWEDQSTWPSALEGINKMYITYYPDLAVPGAYEAVKNLIAAAKVAGVEKAVLLSGKGEKEAERCEAIVAQSGLAYTLVRASWFSQNFSESFLLEPILAGHVALPMPHAKIPFVDTDDIAEVAVKALLEDSHNGKTYEVTGPRALSFAEAIQEIAQKLNRKIHFQAITLEEYDGMLNAASLPPDYVWLISYLFREVLGNEKNQYISNDVEKVLGRKAKDFSEYIQNTIKSGIWNQNMAQSV